MTHDKNTHTDSPSPKQTLNLPAPLEEESNEQDEYACIRQETDRIMAHINQQKAIDNPRPLENNLARPIVEEMQQALVDNAASDMKTTLHAQSQILDKAFRRLFSDAETRFENNETCQPDLAKYITAFRAQDLYCRTARAINILENNTKTPKRSKTKKTPPRQTN